MRLYPRSGEHPVRQDAWINVSREMLADTAAPIPLQVSGILDTGLDPHAAVQLKPPFGDCVRYQHRRLSPPKSCAEQIRRWMLLGIPIEELCNLVLNSELGLPIKRQMHYITVDAFHEIFY